MMGAIGLAVPAVHAAIRLAGHSAVHSGLVSPGNWPYRPVGQDVLVGWFNVSKVAGRSQEFYGPCSITALGTYSPRGGTHGWPEVAAWTFDAVGDIDPGAAGCGIPTLWAICARIESVCAVFICAHVALFAAAGGIVDEKSTVAANGVLGSRDGI